jgi:hypothetical protein
MYSEDQLAQVLSQEVFSYLRNKHRGGINNQKGNTYENFFAIYQIALLAPEAIAQTANIYILSQIPAFVDDLIIDRGADSTLQHYQIKETQSLSWGTDTSQVKIAYDFRLQFDLNTQALNRTSEIFLVTSSDHVANELTASIPNDLRSYSSVIFFPYRSTLNALLQISNDLKNAIAYLTAFESPTQDKIECVASVLLGAWVSSDTSQTTVLEILQKARNCQPSFIRSLSLDKSFALASKVVFILQSIDGFTYELSKGFFHWQYQVGTVVYMDGTYPFSLDSEDFQKFQKLIMQLEPNSFDELENLL